MAKPYIRCWIHHCHGQIVKLHKQGSRMPTLNWIGKEAVIRHHKEVPFRLLEPCPELSSGDSGNLLVQGDNLDALKALLPRYAGKVKCIYIDPPYNTGNEGWSYNDNVNSPEIRKWLGQVVGKEGETLDRHDRWLCMMYPRLVLLKQFLREDGAIFISIGDDENANLKLMCNEVFGANNFVDTIVWQKIYTIKNSAQFFSGMHDYIVVYAKNKSRFNRNLLPRPQKLDATYANPDNDLRGPWTTNAVQARNYNSNGIYEIISPTGKKFLPPLGTYWRTSKENFELLDQDNRIWWGKNKSSTPRIKKFLSEAKQGVVPSTLWLHNEAGQNADAKLEIRDILNEASQVFITPKPTRLIQRILQIATDKDSIILDSFAGSGTTGHAVLKQNAEDGGNRKFILVEMDRDIAENVTAERLKRVCNGYENAKGQKIEGLSSGFQYCRLSEEPLFTPDGQIRDDVSFEELAAFVWFLETRTGCANGVKSPLLGVHEGKAIYLLYNGILGDKSRDGGNTLTPELYHSLPPHDGQKIIYAAACWGSDWLREENITFKQTPYELEVR